MNDSIEQSHIEFFKEPNSENERVTVAEVVGRIPMDVGGFYKEEDKKFFLILRLFRRNHSKDIRFAGKEFMSLDEDEVKKLVAVYNIARKIGLPVPITTRYFITDDYLPAILMSDMTENGKYRVWGYNNNPTKNEHSTLMAMKLTKEQIETIKVSATKIMKLATENHFYLQFNHYHIRQNISTGEFEVILLDLDENCVQYRQDLIPKQNETELTDFFEALDAARNYVE